jgi:flagellar basal body-associated protein FliL
MSQNQAPSLQNSTDSREEQLLEKNSMAQEEINKITKDISLKALEDTSTGSKVETKKVTKGKTSDNHGQTKDEVTVYAMPKQFVGAKEERSKKISARASDLNNKKFIFLLVPLLLLLLAGAVAAYFLVIRRPVPNPALQEPAQETPLAQQVESEGVPPVQEAEQEQGTTAVEQEQQVTEEAPLVQEPPAQAEETEPEPVLDQDLIQKVAVSYNEQGAKTTEAVLSLEKEPQINYSLITISQYIPEEKPEYFALVAGQAYEIKLRGQEPSSKTILSITYSENLLAEQDLIPADLRIGYLSSEVLAKEDIYQPKEGEDPPEIWRILKAQDLDDKVRSVSSVMDGLAPGIYAIVPIDVNKMIELPAFAPDGASAGKPAGTEDIVLTLDTDKDLLTDLEELLYGTSPLVADSDNDGYDDGAEVLMLYSPARGAGKALEEDSQFKRWQNPDYNYSVIAPSSFTASPVSQESNKDIIFKASNNESILISLQDNQDGLTLQEWLLSISPDINLDDWQDFTTKGGFAAIVAANKVIYYVDVPDSQYIFVFSYTSPGQYSYLTTLRMMVESLEYHKT